MEATKTKTSEPASHRSRPAASCTSSPMRNLRPIAAGTFRRASRVSAAPMRVLRRRVPLSVVNKEYQITILRGLLGLDSFQSFSKMVVFVTARRRPDVHEDPVDADVGDLALADIPDPQLLQGRRSWKGQEENQGKI